MGYEFKIRVTIAASGQGRWAEELSFPEDARAAGFDPMLVVFDSTDNEKLAQLCEGLSGGWRLGLHRRCGVGAH